MTSSHYFIECKEGSGNVIIVAHTYDKEKDEYYYKFMDRKKALKMADDERKINPKNKYRLVKVSTSVTKGGWA